MGKSKKYSNLHDERIMCTFIYEIINFEWHIKLEDFVIKCAHNFFHHASFYKHLDFSLNVGTNLHAAHLDVKSIRCRFRNISY